MSCGGPSRGRALEAFLCSAGCLAVALATACSDPIEPAAPAVVDAVLESAPVPLVRTLAVQLDRPARLEATYWTDGEQPLRVAADTEREQHALVLARLLPERDYTVEAYALDERGRPGTARRLQFRTAPLPADLAALRFHATGQPTYALTMVEITIGNGYLGFITLDSDGRVVWFYRTRGSANGMTRLANGNFVAIDQSRGLLHLAPTGEVLAEIAQDSADRRIHHDVIELSGGSVLFLAADRKAARGTIVAGEAVWEWHPETGALAKRWSAWDHLDAENEWGPLSRDHDWLHANSLALGPRGNVVVSLHYLNQVLSIAPGYASLEWRLGGPGASMQVPDAERFSGQHTAAEIAPNRLLMFDNGFERVTERYSRAVEFALEPAAGRATKVWEWRPTPDHWSRIVSLARRLPGGNSFVAFGGSVGARDSTGPVVAYEITPAGAVVWQVVIEGVLLMYRAWPLSDLAGEAPAPANATR